MDACDNGNQNGLDDGDEQIKKVRNWFEMAEKDEMQIMQMADVKLFQKQQTEDELFHSRGGRWRIARNQNFGW